ncbi:hypothetical protein [Xanthocytophaga agilis]|uniref:Uncharacterized protein n=1 Tax=Xanthocytophaga agilis TaxID=3048010 RepID=A0AAE3UG90_9BACT|nr:hypothetical protein [Xanthocytophaga agilis]MDJ1503041.1 hypothetical protein [Xanthocytophaga agilis]
MYKPKPPIDPEAYARKIKSVGDSRRETQRVEEENKRKEVLSSPRPIDEDLSIRGIGQLKVQILYMPPFEINYIWDIRQEEETGIQTYSLYENVLISRKTIAPGYKKILIPAVQLTQLLEKIYATSIPFRITPMNGVGLDGTLYGIHIFENFFRTIKVSWWEEPQDDLVELHKLLALQIELFKNSKDKILVV